MMCKKCGVKEPMNEYSICSECYGRKIRMCETCGKDMTKYFGIRCTC